MERQGLACRLVWQVAARLGLACRLAWVESVRPVAWQGSSLGAVGCGAAGVGPDRQGWGRSVTWQGKGRPGWACRLGRVWVGLVRHVAWCGASGQSRARRLVWAGQRWPGQVRHLAWLGSAWRGSSLGAACPGPAWSRSECQLSRYARLGYSVLRCVRPWRDVLPAPHAGYPVLVDLDG